MYECFICIKLLRRFVSNDFIQSHLLLPALLSQEDKDNDNNKNTKVKSVQFENTFDFLLSFQFLPL